MKSSTALHDIRNEGDIKTLVDTAFSKANDDELLAPLCQAVAQIHWPRHLTSLYDFWSSTLLGTSRYRENEPIPLHSMLTSQAPRSQRWISLLERTVEEQFSGSKAEEAKHKLSTLFSRAHTA
ncbi:group III truncated hemoglobin [Hymenobacter sp. BT730]|uniref:group III truncated hemoglobin n=1 Tax=Hymenobacter sp. BT730 TaxID=3063332 RepID=UPI0026DF2D35|nr:group III truncated hemoglobin [Hymenobacter sp. BT730]